MHRYLILLICLTFVSAVKAAEADDSHQSYALDKLANAQAQLERLKGQEKALNQLIQAVKKDLRAAKVRARAERIQLQANTARQDAAVMVEQTGVAVDLPNLMTAKGVQAGILEYDKNQNENIDAMFKDRSTTEKSVYFPNGSAGKKVKPSNSYSDDADFPDYIK